MTVIFYCAMEKKSGGGGERCKQQCSHCRVLVETGKAKNTEAANER